MNTLPLFDDRTIAGRPREQLAERLRALSKQGILIGTSSWKYEGWLGQVYSHSRYRSRGRFSRKKFEQQCLAEYAETFPVVCGDFSFYQFPSPSYWERLFTAMPADFQFAFKVPEEITVAVWPGHSRYGTRAGRGNPSFLDADVLRSQFLESLAPYRSRVAALIFEFGAFSQRIYPGGAHDFAADLNPFLDRLPGTFRYGVEIRNREFLEPSYFTALRNHGVAHVFSSWAKMPSLAEQCAIGDAYTADFVVSRALLRPGRRYEQAVSQFSPYTEVKDAYPDGTDALKQLIGEAGNQAPALIFVNNRFEGNAPTTISTLVL